MLVYFEATQVLPEETVVKMESRRASLQEEKILDNESEEDNDDGIEILRVSHSIDFLALICEVVCAACVVGLDSERQGGYHLCLQNTQIRNAISCCDGHDSQPGFVDTAIVLNETSTGSTKPGW